MVSNACPGFCAAVLLSFWLSFGLILGWNGEEQEAAEEQGRMVAIGGNTRDPHSVPFRRHQAYRIVYWTQAQGKAELYPQVVYKHPTPSGEEEL